MGMQNEGVQFNGDTFMEQEFLRLKTSLDITTVIETGTYHGDTTKWLVDNFETVHTIEVNETYQRIAKLNVALRTNLTYWTGSSAEILRDVIKVCKQDKLLIFLDAHWWANPVLKELDQIAEAGIKPVIAIHDFKNPDDLTMGYDVYPNQKIIYEWDWVKDRVEKIYGPDGYTKYYNKEATGARRGCLFIIPI